MRKVLFALALSLAAVFATTAGARLTDDAVKTTPSGTTSNAYIVRMAEQPAVTYEGDIAGFPATAPPSGKKVDRTDKNVQKYVAHLTARHADVARAVGAAKFYDYTYAYNGFAAVLTRSQVAQLRKRGDVLSVEQDRLQRVQTDNTPEFLGLGAGGGIWEQLGGPKGAGENVVVGVIDTGIWPEHPSFSDQDDLSFQPGSTGKATRAYGAPPSTWHGTCQAGEQWSQDHCGNKLIGARYFLNGYGHFGVLKNDYKSARDADGHGSHTASTAAGNHDVPASIMGSDLGKVSGMAPRARVAAYKVCWNGEAGGCPNTDSVAAIDAAIADGVDVINFSISGSQTNYVDAVEWAFLVAAANNVFVAASAGNSGPGASTVAHPSPWLTTVAASTHDRSFVGTVTLGNGVSYKGVTLTGGLAAAPIVTAAAAGDELCRVGALNPSVVSGNVVLCKRGDNARVDKSLAVKQAGGVGMVLYNASDAQTLNTDNHHLPSLHVNNTDGGAIKTYVTTGAGSKTASLSGGQREIGGGNVMADFSSRGPSLAGGDVLKPDITAPGVNVLAANTPTAFLGAPGQLFQSIGGTSMSSPHVAGLAALLVHKFPTFNPSMIKSTLMTTAYQAVTKEDGTTPADPFDFGAGHAAPNAATNPGLVYRAATVDYLRFLCGNGSLPATNVNCTNPAVGTASKPFDLNIPSIAVGKVAGVETVARRLTNVSGAAATYTVSVEEPAGFDVQVSPSTLTFGASGASATRSYTLAITRETAAFGEYAFGSVTWSNGSSNVRSPLVLRAVAIAAPAEITGTPPSGSKDVEVRFGFTSNAFSAAAQGLQASTETAGSVGDDPTNDFNTDAPDSNQGITTHAFTVPAGTPVARFQTFGSSSANDDLDMYVYKVVGTTKTLVGLSGGGASTERVTVANPAGDYVVYIHGWEVAAPASYTLHSWVLDPSPAGNMTVTAPSSTTTGGTGTIGVSWSGLDATKKYLGRVSYRDGATEVGGTLVSIQ